MKRRQNLGMEKLATRPSTLVVINCNWLDSK